MVKNQKNLNRRNFDIYIPLIKIIKSRFRKIKSLGADSKLTKWKYEEWKNLFKRNKYITIFYNWRFNFFACYQVRRMTIGISIYQKEPFFLKRTVPFFIVIWMIEMRRNFILFSLFNLIFISWFSNSNHTQ